MDRKGPTVKIRELPIEERPREKMLTEGREALSNGELLAILLRTGTKEKTAIRLAQEIISMDTRGIAHLHDCTIEELSNIKGIGLAKATQILAAIELGQRIATAPKTSKVNIKNTKDVSDIFMEKMRYYSKEVFDVIMVNTKGDIISVENVSVGDLSSSIVHPRETYRSPIKRGAYGVIFIHNHPSGDPTPSAEDIETTKRLCQAGEIIGIKVLDHVIIGDGSYVSLREKGII